MFKRDEIEEKTGVDIFRYIEASSNDCAVKFYVENPEDYNDEYAKFNQYFIDNGININEVVWIDITW